MTTPCTDTRSSVTVALQHLDAEFRASVQDCRNAQRLRAWRVRWWREFGWWPQDATSLPDNVVRLGDRRRMSQPLPGPEAA